MAPTSIISCRRSSSACFHCRRSHCHLPRNAARAPGASRKSPDHRLRPLPALEAPRGAGRGRDTAAASDASPRLAPEAAAPALAAAVRPSQASCSATAVCEALQALLLLAQRRREGRGCKAGSQAPGLLAAARQTLPAAAASRVARASNCLLRCIQAIIATVSQRRKSMGKGRAVKGALRRGAGERIRARMYIDLTFGVS